MRLGPDTYSSAETTPEVRPSEGLSYDLTTIRVWRAVEGLQSDLRWQRTGWAMSSIERDEVDPERKTKRPGP